MADQTPILDLSSTFRRETIRLEGTAYEVRNANDLTLSQHTEIESSWPRVAELMGKAQNGKLETKAAEELRALLLDACQMALIAPAAVVTRQGDLNLILIFDAFLKLLSPALQAARARLLGAVPTLAPPPPPASAGARSSRGLPASTAARRASGSRRSR